jgi:iron(III) transport system permease protein
MGQCFTASLVVMPLLVIFLSWLEFDGQIWQHLADTLLMDLLRNTLVLLFGVGLAFYY